DSNLRPTVLETAALPTELRPSVRGQCIGVGRRLHERKVVPAPARISFARHGYGGATMSEYLAVIEREGEAWGAYCPDLPGVGVAGETREEVEALIREAVSLHLEALREAGDEIPAPSAVGTTLVAVPGA